MRYTGVLITFLIRLLTAHDALKRTVEVEVDLKRTSLQYRPGGTCAVCGACMSYHSTVSTGDAFLVACCNEATEVDELIDLLKLTEKCGLFVHMP